MHLATVRHQEPVICQDENWDCLGISCSSAFIFLNCMHRHTLKTERWRHWEERWNKTRDWNWQLQCVCARRTAASDVDCCCLLRVLGSFLFLHCSWRHNLSNRTCKTLYIQRVHKSVRLKHAQSMKQENTLEQTRTLILTHAHNNTIGGMNHIHCTNKGLMSEMSRISCFYYYHLSPPKNITIGKRAVSSKSAK